MAAGKIISYAGQLAASSVIQPELYRQRREGDLVFMAGDEVTMTLDCSAHTLRLQSPTVDHVIDILEQHQHPQQQWVLNVNFFDGPQQLAILHPN